MVSALFPISLAPVADWLGGIAFHMSTAALYAGEVNAVDGLRFCGIHVRRSNFPDGQRPYSRLKTPDEQLRGNELGLEKSGGS
jgi:hypothetical protein